MNRLLILLFAASSLTASAQSIPESCSSGIVPFGQVLIPDSGGASLTGPVGFDYTEWDNGTIGPDVILNSDGLIRATALKGEGIGQNAARLVNESPQTAYQGSWSNGFSTNGELLRESPNNEWTFALWVKLDSGDSHQSIIGKELWWGNGYRIWISPNGLNSYFRSEFDGGLGVVSAGEVGWETWTHLAVTHDGLTRKHYIDGEVVQSWQDSSSFEFGTHTVGIGWCASGFDCTFNGQMDDFGIWHAALSTEEIQSWMSCPLTATEENLVAYWDFEDNAQGSYFQDKSGYNHHLTPINDPEISSTPLKGGCTVDSCIVAEYSVEFEVVGCTDTLACNFSPLANVSSSECDYSCCPGPGCCFDGTTWDYNLEQCVPSNSADINNDGCVQLNDLLDVLSAYGNCGAEESAWQCGDPLEYQGYDYATVQIGEQCWFAENLRAENYSNGDSVLSSLTDSGWASTNEGAAVVYGESETCVNHSPVIDACDPTESLVEYGRLYNGYAIIDSRGLCPSGWGIPTDAQWQSIISLVGGASVAGGALKADFGWNSGGNGNDSFGFSGEPGGDRNVNGECVEAGRDGDWWTSTLTGNTILAWEMYHNNSTINQLNGPLNSGFSVRCIKDAE